MYIRFTLLLLATVIILSSCSCSRQTYHITSWQEPVFLNDSTLIVIGWEEDFKEPGMVSSSEYLNGAQTLYHYSIPRKTLSKVITLRENDMGGTDYHRVRLQYPWLFYAFRSNNDEVEVALRNLETGEEEVFQDGTNPIFVIPSGRYVCYEPKASTGFSRSFDRHENEIVLKQSDENWFSPSWIIEDLNLVFGTVDKLLSNI